MLFFPLVGVLFCGRIINAVFAIVMCSTVQPPHCTAMKLNLAYKICYTDVTIRINKFYINYLKKKFIHDIKHCPSAVSPT